jgi:hypothetical protein
MAKETLEKIKEKVQFATSIDSSKKEELMALLKELDNEIKDIPDDEKALSITGFTEVSTREAIREEPKQELVDISLKGLGASVDEFEVSHPKLVSVVNRISMMLSNIGI